MLSGTSQEIVSSRSFTNVASSTYVDLMSDPNVLSRAPQGLLASSVQSK